MEPLELLLTLILIFLTIISILVVIILGVPPALHALKEIFRKPTIIDFPFEPYDKSTILDKIPRPVFGIPWFDRPTEKKQAKKSGKGKKILVIGRLREGKTRYAIQQIIENVSTYDPVIFYTRISFEVPQSWPKGIPNDDVALLIDELPVLYLSENFQDKLSKTLEFFENNTSHFCFITTAKIDELGILGINSAFWDGFDIIRLKSFNNIRISEVLDILSEFFGFALQDDVKKTIIDKSDWLLGNMTSAFNALKGKKSIDIEDTEIFRQEASRIFNTLIYPTLDKCKALFDALATLKEAWVISDRDFVLELASKMQNVSKKQLSKCLEDLLKREWISGDEILVVYDAYLEGKANFQMNLENIIDVLRESKSKPEIGLLSFMSLADRLGRDYDRQRIKVEENILNLNPRNALAHYNYAILLKEQKRFGEAEEHYKTALEINPKYAEAHANLGFLYLFKKDSEKALFHLEKALSMREELPDGGERIIKLLEELKHVSSKT